MGGQFFAVCDAHGFRESRKTSISMKYYDLQSVVHHALSANQASSGKYAPIPESRQPTSVDHVYPEQLHPLSIKPSQSEKNKEEIPGYNHLDFCETSFQSDFVSKCEFNGDTSVADSESLGTRFDDAQQIISILV